MAKAKRTTAQKRATQRMLAANRARRSAAHHSHKKASHGHAAKRRPAAHKKAGSSAVRQAAAPAHHKVKHHAKRAAARVKSGAGKLKLGVKPILDDVLIPVAIGGAGASVVDVIYGAARKILPDSMVDHPVAKPVMKLGLGIGLAYGAQKLGMKPAHAKLIAVGTGMSLVHGAINDMVSKNTSLNLNGVGMTVGDLAAMLPEDVDMNGLETLGAVMVSDAAMTRRVPAAA